MRRLGPAGRTALIEGWPVLITALLVGLSFGVLARQSGIDTGTAIAMSVFVFAGAAQFAALELFAQDTPAALVVLTVFLVNLRHLLMSAALRPFFGGESIRARLGLAYILTDEAFALGIGWFRRGHREVAYYVVFGSALWLCWNVATIAGSIAGSRIGDPARLGLDFAITATFIAIVTLGIRTRRDIAVALLAAAIAGALRVYGASSAAVVIAGALAPLIALRADSPAE